MREVCGESEMEFEKKSESIERRRIKEKRGARRRKET